MPISDVGHHRTQHQIARPLGKSLRKKGFVAEGLAEELEEVANRANVLLAAWVDAEARVWVDSPGPELTARRTWHCALPGGEASIPCGGTHVPTTAALGASSGQLPTTYVTPSSAWPGVSRLVMRRLPR